MTIAVGFGLGLEFAAVQTVAVAVAFAVVEQHFVAAVDVVERY